MSNDDLSPPPPEDDPEGALGSVVALRQLADRLELRAVRAALRKGWSWTQIAQCMGVSKQAAHKRLAHLIKDDSGDRNV